MIRIIVLRARGSVLASDMISRGKTRLANCRQNPRKTALDLGWISMIKKWSLLQELCRSE